MAILTATRFHRVAVLSQVSKATITTNVGIVIKAVTQRTQIFLLINRSSMGKKQRLASLPNSYYAA